MRIAVLDIGSNSTRLLLADVDPATGRTAPLSLGSGDHPTTDAGLVRGPDPLIVGTTAYVIGRDEHILGKSLHPDRRHVAKS